MHDLHIKQIQLHHQHHNSLAFWFDYAKLQSSPAQKHLHLHNVEDETNRADIVGRLLHTIPRGTAQCKPLGPKKTFQPSFEYLSSNHMSVLALWDGELENHGLLRNVHDQQLDDDHSLEVVFVPLEALIFDLRLLPQSKTNKHSRNMANKKKCKAPASLEIHLNGSDVIPFGFQNSFLCSRNASCINSLGCWSSPT